MAKQNTQRMPTKTPIKFGFQLSEDQKEAKTKILDNRIALVTGAAGTGKSSLIANIALDGYMSKKVFNRIQITRPTVNLGNSRGIGYQPGDKWEKMLVYNYALLDNMQRVLDTKGRDGKQELKKMIEEGVIDTIPIEFIRGHNTHDEILLVDEVQNLLPSEIKAICTRLTSTGKIIFSGDIEQCDIQKDNSGLMKLIELCSVIDGMVHVELTTNHRDPLVEQILKHF